MLVGYLILILGHKSSEIASLMMVNDPIYQSLAGNNSCKCSHPDSYKENHPGIISKKGFTSVVTRLGCVIIHAPCPR